MKTPDKIKAVFATCTVAAVILSFGFLGKDHTLTRWLAAGGIIGWLGLLFYINRINDKKENPDD